MDAIEKEVDRVLTLLRNKIRERGFTQLEVQSTLGWGRSYISQLLTKQKGLRVEQVLRILEVIGVDAFQFYAELYNLNSERLTQQSLSSGRNSRNTGNCCGA
jgi:transcriptional regulator with XRE-family HTH domain